MGREGGYLPKPPVGAEGPQHPPVIRPAEVSGSSEPTKSPSVVSRRYVVSQEYGRMQALYPDMKGRYAEQLTYADGTSGVAFNFARVTVHADGTESKAYYEGPSLREHFADSYRGGAVVHPREGEPYRADVYELYFRGSVSRSETEEMHELFVETAQADGYVVRHCDIDLSKAGTLGTMRFLVQARPRPTTGAGS